MGLAKWAKYGKTIDQHSNDIYEYNSWHHLYLSWVMTVRSMWNQHLKIFDLSACLWKWWINERSFFICGISLRVYTYFHRFVGLFLAIWRLVWLQYFFIFISTFLHDISNLIGFGSLLLTVATLLSAQFTFKIIVFFFVSKLAVRSIWSSPVTSIN